MKFTFQRLIYLLFILSSTAMATEAGDEVRAESG